MISKDLLNTDSIDERDLITEEGPNDKDEHSWHRVKQQLEQELVSANKIISFFHIQISNINF
ncbi:hypothetical protein A0H76_2566 [Hepatospora eriocheir]|uniref:Uncharacterized protein n=1 Tax=Hepatospora eriocheir TaxID=1081669 RepID=A0A1X0QJN4_9MICR|nr:hypothetical protein A0H76_2566 [Hepatospora eriocheir]